MSKAMRFLLLDCFVSFCLALCLANSLTITPTFLWVALYITILLVLICILNMMVYRLANIIPFFNGKLLKPKHCWIQAISVIVSTWLAIGLAYLIK